MPDIEFIEVTIDDVEIPITRIELSMPPLFEEVYRACCAEIDRLPDIERDFLALRIVQEHLKMGRRRG